MQPHTHTHTHTHTRARAHTYMHLHTHLLSLALNFLIFMLRKKFQKKFKTFQYLEQHREGQQNVSIKI